MVERAWLGRRHHNALNVRAVRGLTSDVGTRGALIRLAGWPDRKQAGRQSVRGPPGLFGPADDASAAVRAETVGPSDCPARLPRRLVQLHEDLV